MVALPRHRIASLSVQVWLGPNEATDLPSFNNLHRNSRKPGFYAIHAVAGMTQMTYTYSQDHGFIYNITSDHTAPLFISILEHDDTPLTLYVTYSHSIYPKDRHRVFTSPINIRVSSSPQDASQRHQTLQQMRLQQAAFKLKHEIHFQLFPLRRGQISEYESPLHPDSPYEAYLDELHHMAEALMALNWTQNSHGNYQHTFFTSSEQIKALRPSSPHAHLYATAFDMGLYNIPAILNIIQCHEWHPDPQPLTMAQFPTHICCHSDLPCQLLPLDSGLRAHKRHIPIASPPAHPVIASSTLAHWYLPEIERTLDIPVPNFRLTPLGRALCKIQNRVNCAVDFDRYLNTIRDSLRDSLCRQHLIRKVAQHTATPEECKAVAHKDDEYWDGYCNPLTDYIQANLPAILTDMSPPTPNTDELQLRSDQLHFTIRALNFPDDEPHYLVDISDDESGFGSA